MKYIMVVGDGMADYPIDELDGKTPLEVSNKPNMDRLAGEGIVGLVKTIPDGMPAGSDVANLTLLGYDPKRYYKGRASLEAASMGITLKDDEIGMRCNLVTVRNGRMVDFSSGHIKTEEAAKIIKLIDEKLGSNKIKFYPGVSYRHLLIIHSSFLPHPFSLIATPPHNITGEKYADYLPKGEGSQILIELMEKSFEILKGRENGNMVWFWGEGTSTTLPKLTDRFKIKGSAISAVDLVKGLAILAGLKSLDVPGITGYYDTDYNAKARYGISSLKDNDLVFIHIEAPDEAGHNKDVKNKIKAIEEIDKKIIGYILENQKKEFRILLVSDHFTPISLGMHTNDPPPFVIWGKGIEKGDISCYNENCARDGVFFEDGTKLIEEFIKC
ncbi:TPA: cofactor-independent phosphoglycerate mutase [bacterium]|nr:cofactor-independent phosphoglycerate mutase [bacterium]